MDAMPETTDPYSQIDRCGHVVVETSAALHPFFPDWLRSLAKDYSSRPKFLVVLHAVLDILRLLAADGKTTHSASARDATRAIDELRARCPDFFADDTVDASRPLVAVSKAVECLSTATSVFVVTNDPFAFDELEREHEGRVSQRIRKYNVYFGCLADSQGDERSEIIYTGPATDGPIRQLVGLTPEPPSPLRLLRRGEWRRAVATGPGWVADRVGPLRLMRKWWRARRGDEPASRARFVAAPSAAETDLASLPVVFVSVGDHEESLILGDEIPTKGGEGSIHAVRYLEPAEWVDGQTWLCKIYASRQLSEHRKPKVIKLIEMMPAGAAGLFAWPEHVVCDQRGRFRGFLMRQLEGETLARSPFAAHYRRDNHHRDRGEFVRLALFLVKALAFLHEHAVWVMDLKPENIFFNDGRLVLIDCDSFSIPGYPSEMYDLRYLSPQFQKRTAAVTQRDLNDELFAVAVLLFVMLMNGQHPYAHQGGHAVSANIVKGLFPYRLDGSASDKEPFGDPKGIYFRLWTHLSRQLRSLFCRAFEPETRESHPVALADWQSAWPATSRS